MKYPVKEERTYHKSIASEAKKSLGEKPSFPYSFNFMHAQDYRKKFLTNDVRQQIQCSILEYFIVMSDHYLLQGFGFFYHSNSQLHRDLGHSVQTIRKVTNILIEAKILKKSNDSPTDTSYFELNYLILAGKYRKFICEDRLSGKFGDDVLRRYKERVAHLRYMHKLRGKIEVLLDLDD